MFRASRLLRHAGRFPEILRAARLTPDAWTLLQRYVSAGGGRYPVLTRLRDASTLEFEEHEEVAVFWQIFVRRCYPLPAGARSIVDCGANIGLFAIWAAGQNVGARIVSVEPFPATYRRLVMQVVRNGLQQRVSTIQAAVAAVSGERQFIADGPSPNRHLALGSSQAANPAETVRCYSLEELLDRHAPGPVDFLKMDIEGSEWETLLGAPSETLRRVRFLSVEYHEVPAALGYSFPQLERHLSAAGFVLVSREEDECRTGLANFRLGAVL